MSAYRPYPKYKPSGVEWLGEVPDGWEVKPLKVIATFNDDVLSENFGEDEEIEYVDIGSVSLETGIECTETFRFGDAPSRARRRVRDGDVIASTVRTYLKAIAPVVAPPATLIVSTGFAVIRPRNGLDSHFAKFSLQSGYFVDEVISRSTGVSYPAINASEMAAISLTLPPLPEQHQIASFLDRECGKLDALQAKQERLIELLKEKRQALISHAVTRGLDPTAKLKPSGIEWLGEVPEHWRVFPAKRVSSIFVPQRNKPELNADGDGVCWMTMEQMRAEEITTTALWVSEQAARDAGTRILKSGAVIASCVGTFGLATINNADVIINQQLQAFIPSDQVEAKFLRHCVINSAGYFDQIGTAATITYVNQLGFENMPIALPPLAEQRAIVAHLDEKCGKIDELKAKAERAIALLKERRSALISAAVTGKIDVRDALPSKTEKQTD